MDVVVDGRKLRRAERGADRLLLLLLFITCLHRQIKKIPLTIDVMRFTIFCQSLHLLIPLTSSIVSPLSLAFNMSTEGQVSILLFHQADLQLTSRRLSLARLLSLGRLVCKAFVSPTYLY